MSSSTEQAPNHPPDLPRRRASGLGLVCVAVIVMLIVSASLFWLARDRSSASASQKQATPTATTMPTLGPTITTTPLMALFYDTFANNFHGWSLNSNGGYFRILTNNSLILADTNPNSTLVEPVPTLTNLDNYVVSADFTINQGDAHDNIGFYLRGDSTLFHDYRIDINGNNTLDVAREYLDANQAGQSAMLVPPAYSSYLHPLGKPNTLTVFMIGSQITVEINNIVVMTATDNSYTNGQITLFARHGVTSSGVTVSFTRVEIDHLTSQFMTPVPTLTLTATPSVTTGEP